MLYNETIEPARGLALLIDSAPEETKTRGGLVLPKNPTRRDAAEQFDAVAIRARIVSIGPPALDDAGREIPLDGIAEGDEVIVRPGWATTVHIIDDQVHYLVPQQAIGGRILFTGPPRAK
jgi:co-chaperonin GroES (HSP10)